MLSQMICRMAGHSVNRLRVWHDGLDYRTQCQRCRKSLVRDRHGWRSFDTARDHDPRRHGHPHSAT